MRAVRELFERRELLWSITARELKVRYKQSLLGAGWAVLQPLALALLASTINVFYRDVKYAVPLGMQLWMFASPVAYLISVVPAQYRTLYMLNPMATIIESYRTVLLKGSPPNFVPLAITGVASLLLLFLCYGYFKRKERVFADVI